MGTCHTTRTLVPTGPGRPPPSPVPTPLSAALHPLDFCLVLAVRMRPIFGLKQRQLFELGALCLNCEPFHSPLKGSLSF